MGVDHDRSLSTPTSPPTTMAPTAAPPKSSTPTKPTSKSLEHLFSAEGQRMVGSTLKEVGNKINQMRGELIPLAVGRPTSELYPWNTVILRESSLPNAKPVGFGPQTRTIPMHSDAYDLRDALNYGSAQGSSELIDFFSEHVAEVHNPPYADWNIALTCGSTSGFEIALRIFCDRGDTILMEEYTYPGAKEVTALLGVQVQGLKMDSNGLRPESLQDTLQSWDESRGPKPRVLYIIPSGQNPTGATLSLERRKAIYEIAEKHDIVIIEDDPYYYLQLDCDLERNGVAGSECSRTADYLARLLPSFASLDHSGRVVRLDSTSKILAPGLRAGWVTANTKVIEKFLAFHDLTIVHVAGPTQAMLWALLCQSWGQQGFKTWLDNLSREYRLRRDIMLEASEKHLPRQICDWRVPHNGMFHWISLNWKQHPFFVSTINDVDGNDVRVAAGIAEIEDKILAKTLDRGVQVARGSMFAAEKASDFALHFRMTFAAASNVQLCEGVRIFAEVVREEFKLRQQRYSI